MSRAGWRRPKGGRAVVSDSVGHVVSCWLYLRQAPRKWMVAAKATLLQTRLRGPRTPLAALSVCLSHPLGSHAETCTALCHAHRRPRPTDSSLDCPPLLPHPTLPLVGSTLEAQALRLGCVPTSVGTPDSPTRTCTGHHPQQALRTAPPLNPPAPPRSGPTHPRHLGNRVRDPQEETRRQARR